MNMKSIAQTLIAVLLFTSGCSKPSEEDLWNKGVDAQKEDNVRDALDAYQQLVKDYPNGTRVAEALYAIGTVYQNDKRDTTKRRFELAIDAYKRIVNEYPDHATASSACFLIGFLYNNELRNVDSSRAAYLKFLEKYPGSPMVESAKFELANLGKEPSEILKPSVTMSSAEKSLPKPKRNR